MDGWSRMDGWMGGWKVRGIRVHSETGKQRKHGKKF